MTQVRFRVDFATGCSIGPGKVELLEGIGRKGSLRQAARALGMSYRRAWLLLDQINHSFAKPATTTAVGGVGGGGARLTAFGEKLIRDYRAFEREIQTLARARLASLDSSTRPRPGRKSRRRPDAQHRRLTRAPSSERAD